jgi:hypothetical protein
MAVLPSPVWAFADETGDVGSSRYLIVAVVLTRNPRLLRKTVAKTRKHLRKKLKSVPELKAKRTPKKVVTRFLRYIAELDVEIVTVVLDKHIALACPEPEEQSIFVRAASTSERTTVGLIWIEHLDSTQEKGIQAADAVVWSLGQRYERGDDELYNIIKDKIIVEEVLRE